jgi:uncharacterized protein YneF (UPF0154 family)
MSQESILNTAKTYINTNNVEGVKTLLFSSDEKPTTSTVSQILRMAADSASWEVVQAICLMNGDNQPSEAAVEYTLDKTYQKNREDQFKFICEQSFVKPSQNALNTVMHSAYAHHGQWNFVQCIYLLNVKLGQLTLDEALKKAASSKRWDVVAAVCTNKNGVNIPTQNAVDEVLELACFCRDMNQVKFIYEQSLVKPSQKKGESLLSSLVREKWWSFVRYISLKNVINGPKQEQLDQALKAAASFEEWDIVEAVCTNENDANKPAQTTIDEVLDRIYGWRNLEQFKLICEQSLIKPSKKKLESLLNAFGNDSEWNFVKYICVHYSDEIGQEQLDGALKKAALWKQWDIVEAVCGTQNDENIPDQKTIDWVLEKAYSWQNIKVFKWICEQSLVKPSEQQIESLLKKLYTDPDLYKNQWVWEFVECLCLSSSEESKPSPEAADKAFEAAASWAQWDLVKKILGSKRVPGILAVNMGLREAAKQGQVDMVRFFSEMTENKLPLQSFKDAFLVAVASNKKDVIDYFCQLKTEQKPNQELIGKALGVAASKGHLKLIEFFLGPDNLTKPLPEDVTKAFIGASSEGSFPVVQYFCQLPETKPDQNLIGQVLRVAAFKGHLKIIEFLLGPDNPVKPLPEDVAKAFIGASSVGSLPSVQYFCMLKTEHKPDQKLIGQALITAISEKHAHIMYLLLASDNPIKPLPEDLHQAFVQAVYSGCVNVVQYFIQENHEQDLTQEQRDNLLLIAVTAPEGDVSIKCFIEKNKKTPIITEESFQKAWFKAKKEGKEDIARLLEPEIKNLFKEQSSDLNKEGVAQNLGKAVSEGKLEETKKLCALVGTDKLTTKILNEALDRAKAPEIKTCLLEAQKMLKLHANIAELEAYGQKALGGSETADGRKVKQVCDQLKLLMNGYVSAHFNNQKELKKNYKDLLSSDLKNAFETMNNHRAKWKINLLNVALGATIIGPAINYAVNRDAFPSKTEGGERHFFFFKTERQKKVEKISETLESLESSNKNNL